MSGGSPDDEGNGSEGKGSSEVCPHDKKPFATREEAEQFEAENRKRFPNRGKQYPYKCPDCRFYHLTSKPPDAGSIGASNLKRMESLASTDSHNEKPVRGAHGEMEAKVKRLWESGKTDRQIAEELQISRANAVYHRKKFGGGNSSLGRGYASHRTPPARTLSEIAQQKQVLEEKFKADMQHLEQEAQRLAQENALVVTECQEGQALYIKFGLHEHMMVPKDKVKELTEQLMQWV